MGGKRITKEDEKVIKDLFDSGFSVSDIVSKTNISCNTVYKILRGNWVEHPTLLNEDDISLIKAFYNNRKSDPIFKVSGKTLRRHGTLKELSEVFNVSLAHIGRIIYGDKD